MNRINQIWPDPIIQSVNAKALDEISSGLARMPILENGIISLQDMTWHEKSTPTPFADSYDLSYEVKYTIYNFTLIHFCKLNLF